MHGTALRQLFHEAAAYHRLPPPALKMQLVIEFLIQILAFGLSGMLEQQHSRLGTALVASAWRRVGRARGYIFLSY